MHWPYFSIPVISHRQQLPELTVQQDGSVPGRDAAGGGGTKTGIGRSSSAIDSQYSGSVTERGYTERLKGVIAVVLGAVLLLNAIGTGAYFLFKLKELLGSESVYDTITLQIENNLFYDVRVLVETKLKSTDGTIIYLCDLLTAGVQDMEPTTFYRVKVGNRWVFTSNENGWLKTIQTGFEQEVPYEGSYDTEDAKWIDTVPDVAMGLDGELLEDLREGASCTFDGQELITPQIAYDTFEVAAERVLLKMSTLYKQPILYGMMADNKLWVSESLYTVAITPINYGTCLVVTSYGDVGRQHAVKLMGDTA